MAFRDAVRTNNGSTTDLVGNMPTTVTGDYLCAFITQDTDGHTYTPPGGWAQITQDDIANPDGQSIVFFEFTGGAPASPAGSYTWTSDSSSEAQVIIASFSGRSLSRTFLQTTGNTSSNATPISASMTGGTAVAHDDLLVIIALDKLTSSDVWSFGTPTGSPGTFILRINNDPGNFTGIGIATLDDIAAGATGSIADTITRSSGSGNSGYAGYVIALASIPPTITSQPTPQTAYENTTATFNISATPASGTLHYQWKLNGSNAGTDSSSYTTGTLTIADNLSTVYCVVTDDSGTATSTTVYLLVLGAARLPWISA